MKNVMGRKIGFWIMTVLLICASTALAGAVPQMINYQGTLTDTSGNPVADGQYAVVFNIYNVATGGTTLWTETWNGATSPVVTSKGNFNVLLGTYSAISASFFDNNPLTYLGIRVGNDSEMLPRQKIVSVGYAFTAGNGVPKGGIIMWSGTVAPPGWALCDGTNGTPDLRSRFIVGAGTGPGLSTYAVGDKLGEEKHVLTVNEMPSHTHTQNAHTHVQDAHTHNVRYQANQAISLDSNSGRNAWQDSAEGTMGAPSNLIGATTASNQNTTGINQNAGGGQPHNNLPPYYALAFIMKL